MATLVLGGVGAAIGSIWGPVGARWGWSIGSVIGSWIDSSNQPGYESGKLSDLRFSGSQYGVAIPRVMGQARVGGQVIWAAVDGAGNHLVQHSRTSGGGGGGSGGGGGGSVTTFWYSSTFAVAFCGGAKVMPDGSIVDRNHTIKKIWADDVLIYDASAGSNVVTPALYSGSETQLPDSTIVASMGVSSGDAPAYRGLVYAVFTDMSLEEFGNRIPNFSALIETDAVTDGDFYSDTCLTCGLDATEIDVTAATGTLKGIAELGRTAGQESVNGVMSARGHDMAEIDGVLTVVPRGGAPVLTISADHMGASMEGTETARYGRSRPMQSELPGRIDVQYYDEDADLAQYTQSDVRQTADVYNSRSLAYPMVMSATEAKEIAQRELDRAYVEVDQLESVAVLPRYMELAPADVVNIPTATGMIRARIVRMSMPPLGPLVLDVVADSDAVVSQPGGGAGGTGGTGNLEIVPSEFMAWSGPELRDEDQLYPGFYVAATGGDGWSGGSVWYSLDAGSTWVQGPSIGGRSVFGVTTSTLSDSGAVAGTFDLTNDVDVDVTESEGALASVSDAQVDAGENIAVVGNEILGFGVATLNAPHDYTLSNLKRGLRGTAMGGHTSSDVFVVASPNLARVNVGEAYVGSTVHVKVLSRYQTLSDVTAETVVIAPRTPTTTETTLASMVVPHFITPVTVQSSTTGTVAWTTFDASSYLPAGATVAILQIEYRIEYPDLGDADAHVLGRKDSSSDVYTLALGRAEGSADAISGANQPLLPITAGREFDYTIETPGFEGGCEIKLIGFFGPVS